MIKPAACEIRDNEHKLSCKLKRKWGMNDYSRAIALFTNCYIISTLSVNIPFVITTAGTRRQLKVEVEFFNVCKLLNILLYEKDIKEREKKNEQWELLFFLFCSIWTNPTHIKKVNNSIIYLYFIYFDAPDFKLYQ